MSKRTMIRVYSDEEIHDGNYVDVEQDADLPEDVINILANEYFGGVRLSLDKKHAKEVAIAILGIVGDK